MSILLNNDELTVRIREDNGAIDLVRFGGSNFYNPGTPVSDFGLQVGTQIGTFVLNTTTGGTGQPVSVIAGDDGSSVIVQGTYTEGGANVDFTRTYSLIDGFNALQVTTEFINNGSDLTLSYFDTFDPDQGVGQGTGFSTFNDVLTLSNDGQVATVGRASETGGLTVFTGSFDPEVTVGAGSPFQINNGFSLNNFFASPFDGDGTIADQGLHVGIRFDLDAGETQTFEYIQGYGETIAEAQIQFLTIEPVQGTNGDDTLDGTPEIDIIDALAGNDLIRGLAGDDFLEGGAGNDTLLGGEDNDNLAGENGDDVLQGETGDDFLEGGTGNDTIGGADGNDSLFGGDGNDILSGGDDRDTIEGSLGDDILSGGRGRDSLFGGNGNDTLKGNPGNDTLRGGNGNDLLLGGNGNDNLTGNGGRDRLFGGNGNDNLTGNEGRDRLFGGNGDDNLFGGNGNDILQGGGGNDFLTGGAGADQFVLVSGQGGETIRDFEDDVDKFILGTGLSFENLGILSTGSDTVITNNNNIVLAVVENTQAFEIGVEDFIF